MRNGIRRWHRSFRGHLRGAGGAVMAVSAVHGRASLPEGGDPKEVAMKSKAQFYGKPGVYRIFNQVPNRFKAKHGKTLCRELTVPWQQSWFARSMHFLPGHHHRCRGDRGGSHLDGQGRARQQTLRGKRGEPQGLMRPGWICADRIRLKWEDIA